MLRHSLIALTAAAGLLGTTELGTQEAKADTFVRIGIGTYRPGYYRPVYPAPVVYAPPPVVYTPAPVVAVPVYSTPIYRNYEVLYRDCGHGPMRLYGTFVSRHRAYEVAASLRAQGFETIIEIR